MSTHIILGMSSQPDVINKSPVNTSKSKSMYSFSKADRFGMGGKKLHDQICYELPSCKMKR